MNPRRPTFQLAAAFVAVLAQSAFRIRQSTMQRAGAPEFKALAEEIKIHWLK